MAIFTVTGGTVLESWKPQPGPLTTMPSILRSLEPLRDDVLVLSGLSHHGRGTGGLNAHEHCSALHLTGAPEVSKVDGRFVTGTSVDQMAARAMGQDTYLSSLELGLSNHETKYSFRPDGTPVPFENDPRLVFDRMFRGREPLIPDWNARRTASRETVADSAQGDSLRRSVLDLVREDAKDLQRLVGREDRRKLDQYLESVASIEKRVAFIEAQARARVADGAVGLGERQLADVPTMPGRDVNWWKWSDAIQSDPEPHAEYTNLMADLLVLAFQTDTTRVATLAVGSDGALFPGVVTVGYERHAHTLEHQGNARRVEEADPIAREGCRQIHAWYTSLFAHMIERMKGIDEGGSSLLANSMVLYTSYMADGGHGCSDYPVLLAGQAGGTLSTGRHIAYRSNTPMSNLFIEMLDRCGAGVKQFGESHTSLHAAYDGRLPDLTL